MGYEIDRGRPIPPARRRGKGGEYPFEELEPGDSFLVGVEELFERYSSQMQTAVATVATQHGKRNGKRFITRLERGEDGEMLGVRVWREK